MPAISIQFRRDRKSKPWAVRYADGPSHRSASFRTKADAQLFAAKLRTDQAAGEWVSPDAGRGPLEQWAEEWLVAYVGRAASTQAWARSALRAHILPRFGQWHLSTIPASTWRGWSTRLSLQGGRLPRPRRRCGK